MTSEPIPFPTSSNRRWQQLALGIVCMMAISSPQYTWALFTQPLMSSLKLTLAEVQVTFSILIVVQTFLSPAQGVLVDRFGPRVLLSFGALLTGASWMLAAHIASPTGMYLTYGLLGGVGTGIIYVGVVGHVVQWFPDRRGLATGLVAAGYGFGALATTFPIDWVIKGSGYTTALSTFGVAFGIVGLAAAQALRRPDRGWIAPAPRGGAPRSSRRDVAPAEMLRTPLFWLMFGMMTMMSTSGLMVTSQMGAFTTDFGLATVLVFGLPLLPLALSIDRITNGATRPFFGWVSDRIGRENTMVIAFALEGVAMTAWLFARHQPTLFALMSGVVFFGWGEIFSLFPSTLTDTFGTKHATSNYGFLYIAQGVGSILGGPLAAALHQRTGSWLPVFWAVIAMNFATALLAHTSLRTGRQRWLSAEQQTADALATASPAGIVTES